MFPVCMLFIIVVDTKIQNALPSWCCCVMLYAMRMGELQYILVIKEKQKFALK